MDNDKKTLIILILDEMRKLERLENKLDKLFGPREESYLSETYDIAFKGIPLILNLHNLWFAEEEALSELIYQCISGKLSIDDFMKKINKFLKIIKENGSKGE